MKTKDAEIDQLKKDLQTKIDENKAQISKIESENKAKQDSILKSKAQDVQDLTALMGTLQTQLKEKDTQIAKLSGKELNEEDMKKACYQLFNQDLKKRIEFLSKVLDWEGFGTEVIDNERASWREQPSIILNPNQEDYVRLHAQMESIYFPIIDMRQHARMNTVEDFVVRDQLNEMDTMISYELLTLSDIMRLVKDPQSSKKSRHSSIFPSGEKNLKSSVIEDESAQTNMMDESG